MNHHHRAGVCGLASDAARREVTQAAQAGLDWSDTRIPEQSRPSERVDAGQAVWQVPVPANGSATVTATFDTRY